MEMNDKLIVIFCKVSYQNVYLFYYNSINSLTVNPIYRPLMMKFEKLTKHAIISTSIWPKISNREPSRAYN